MITSFYESAAFYGAPLSVQPMCHHDLRIFVEIVLKEGEDRLRNLLPLILAKQIEGRRDVYQAYEEWTSGDQSFKIIWDFTQLAIRQIRDHYWSEDDRNRWRQLCEEVGRMGIEPQRALANLRRFL